MKMQHSTHFFRDASHKAIHKRRPLPAPLVGLAVMVSGIAAPLCMAVTPAYAAANSLYLSPSSANVTVNTTFNVGVRINAGDGVNTVEANLTYNQSQLQFLGINASGTAFAIEAPSSGGGGTISIQRGNIQAVSGDKLVATVSFKALASNVTSNVAFASSSQMLSATDNSNVLTSTSSGSYALKAVAAAPPAKTPAPAGTGTKSPAPTSPATPTTPAPTSTAPSPTTPGATTDTPQKSVSPTPSVNSVEESKSSNNTAVLGISGLAVLVIGVATAVIFLRRHHAVAPAPGSFVGDSHATVFGPSQPVQAPTTIGTAQPAPSGPTVVTPSVAVESPISQPLAAAQPVQAPLETMQPGLPVASTEPPQAAVRPTGNGPNPPV